MSLDMDDVIQQIQRLALQHKSGSEYKSDEVDGKTTPAKADVDKLLSEFKSKMTLEESTASETSSPDSELDVDPSHTFSDLVFFADRYRYGAISAHLRAVDLRNWFEKRSMPEHYSVMTKIANDICLRRVDVKVIAKQAEDHCERRGAAVKSVDDKKKLMRLYVKAEVGYSSLVQLESDLSDVHSVCIASEDFGKGSIWDDILVELVRIGNGGKEERPEWMEGWPYLAG